MTVLWDGQVYTNRCDVTSVPWFLPQSWNSGPQFAHILCRWGRGWRAGVGSGFYRAARHAYQFYNVRKEGIVSNLLVVILVFPIGY